MLASIHYGGRSAPKESTSSRALGPTRLTTRGLCAHLLRDLPRTYAHNVTEPTRIVATNTKQPEQAARQSTNTRATAAIPG